MGNHVACALAGAPGGHARYVKVIQPGGEVRRIHRPANAAELMLDAPGHFLVNSRSIHVGRRFEPLTADEDLEVGDIYVMFPMKRVNAIVTEADMAALLMAAQKEVRRRLGAGNRVLPDATWVSPEVPKLELEEMTRVEVAAGHFLVNSRSIHVGRRFDPLTADEDLEVGDIYVMFPMKRVNAIVTEADMAALLMAAQKEVRRRLGGGNRVSPDATWVSPEVPKLEEMTRVEVAAETAEFRYRLSMCRSRRPTLETIAEEGIC